MNYIKPSLNVKNAVRPFYSILMCIFCIGIVTTSSSAARAQEIPNWPAGTGNSSLVMEYGLGLTQYGDSVNPTALYLAYVSGSQSNLIGTGYSLDGTNYVSQGYAHDLNSGEYYQADCNAAHQATCSVAVTTFKGTAYLAYADGLRGGLSVVAITNIPGNVGHYYTLIHNESTVSLTSAPAMVVTPDGSKLLIRYGTSNTSQQNATYNTSFDGANWSTYPSNGFAPTQDAWMVLNGQIFVVEKQNNSSNGVFISKVDNNGVYIPGTAVQLSGFRTRLGFSGTVFNGNIVLALQEDASQNLLYTFSSPDGVNWYQNPNNSNSMSATPALANFNGGLAVGFKANDSSNIFYGAFATQ